MIRFWALVITAAILLAGCAFMQTSVDTVAEKVTKYVNIYCESTDPIYRKEVRDAVNSKMTVEGRNITVQCETPAE